MKNPKNISEYKPGDIIALDWDSIRNLDYARIISREEYVSKAGDYVKKDKPGVLYVEYSGGLGVNQIPVYKNWWSPAGTDKPSIFTEEEVREDLESRIKRTQEEIKDLLEK